MRPRSLRLALPAVRTLALGLTGALTVATVVSACGSKSSPVEAGGECFLATDCAPGLVCVEQPNTTRVCSDDLTQVAGRSPNERPVLDGGDGAADSASVVDGAAPDVVVEPPDAWAPDTSLPDPSDTGVPVDAGSDA